MAVNNRSCVHNTKTGIDTPRNDSGAIAYAGATDGTTVNVDFTKLALPKQNPKVPGPVAQGTSDNNIGVMAAVTTGKHAETIAGNYVGIGYDEVLAGVTTTPLVASYAGSRNAFMGMSGTYTIDYTDWSYVSGVATVASNTITYFGYDKEITATRTAPGSLVYLETGKTPTTGAYVSKTG